MHLGLERIARIQHCSDERVFAAITATQGIDELMQLVNSGSTGNAGTINYAGLAPTLDGLYQVNVQVPSTGLVAGDNVYVEFVTDAADVDQIQIPFGAGAVTPNVVSTAKAALRTRTKHSRQTAHQ